MEAPNDAHMEDRITDSVAAFVSEESLVDGGVDLQLDTDLADLLDSVALIHLVEFLEHEFSIEIPDEDIVPDNFLTLSGISRYVSSRIEAAPNAT
jgi:acyl carrier protein